MNTSYPASFVSLLDNCSTFDVSNYIGQGNPSARILIIGNECTAPLDHYNIETMKNVETWQSNFKNNISIENIPDGEPFNPLNPWKGWIYGGNVKPKGRNSSKTWNAYQKLANQLIGKHAVSKGDKYNFWKYCFITELSTNNMSHSHQNKVKETADSIQARLLSSNGILRTDFFQQFPIIILGCYHYKDIYDIDIEKCFNQKYICTPYDEKVGRISEFIHKHIRIDKNGTPHMLLHTNHFCMRSNRFIDAVAIECNNFIREYGISLMPFPD